jgi:hypothetical protein
MESVEAAGIRSLFIFQSSDEDIIQDQAQCSMKLILVADPDKKLFEAVDSTLSSKRTLFAAKFCHANGLKKVC